MAVEGPLNDAAGARSFAAALRQEADGESLRLLAKGHGAVAEQILEIAFASGIKVRSDAELAAILEAIEPDTELPVSTLAALAEILTYLYRLETRP